MKACCGQRFETSKVNLLRFENTYFTGLLGSGNWKPDADGSYFIDRNPKHFDVVLDYLRGNEKVLERLSDADLETVKEHFDYLLIPFPVAVDQGAAASPWSFDSVFANFTCSFIGPSVLKVSGRNDVPDRLIFAIPNPASFKIKVSGNTHHIGLVYKEIVNGRPFAVTLRLFLPTGILSHIRFEVEGKEAWEWQAITKDVKLSSLGNDGGVVELLFDRKSREVHIRIDTKSGCPSTGGREWPRPRFCWLVRGRERN